VCRPPFVDPSPNITIIGAGLIGLCSAEALAARGASVTVIEARPGPCEGTSFSNSGMIHPSQAQSWEHERVTPPALDAARVTADLGVRSRELLLQKIKRLGLPMLPPGCLKIYPDFEAAQKAQLKFNDIGVEANIVIDPVDTFGLTACQFPNDSSADSRIFGCALAADLKKRGVKFIYDAADVDIRRADGAFNIRVAAQIIKADHLIIAAGIQSGALLERMELRMHLKAVSGAAADFALPEAREDLPSCPVMDSVSRSALTVFDDRVRISGGWNLTDPASLLERWADIAPGLMLRLGRPLSTWTGVRPISPVGRPYISETSIANLWVNTGHGHMGWTLCAGSGELLAQMILEARDDRRFAFSG